MEKENHPIDHRASHAKILGLLIVVLVISNSYLWMSYSNLNSERMNALGLALIRAAGPMSEVIGIMNHTILKHKIVMDLWHVMLRDLIEHSRFYQLIATLDRNHEPQWIRVENGIDALIEATNILAQEWNRRQLPSINITGQAFEAVSQVRDILVAIHSNAFVRTIKIGASPNIVIADMEMARAVDAANRLPMAAEQMQRTVVAD